MLSDLRFPTESSSCATLLQARAKRRQILRTVLNDFPVMPPELFSDNAIFHLSQPWNTVSGTREYSKCFLEPIQKLLGGGQSLPDDKQIRTNVHMLLAGEYDTRNPVHNPPSHGIDATRVFTGSQHEPSCAQSIPYSDLWASACGSHELHVAQELSVNQLECCLSAWLMDKSIGCVSANKLRDSTKFDANKLDEPDAKFRVVLHLRFALHVRFSPSNNQLVEVFALYDIWDLLRQVSELELEDVNPSRWSCLGKQLVPVPGPAGQESEGKFAVQDLEDTGSPSMNLEDYWQSSQQSLELVESMCFKGLTSFGKKKEDVSDVGDSESTASTSDGTSTTNDSNGFERMGMGRYWDAQNMKWYGPAGIGFACSLKEFEDFHQKPFLRGVPDRKGGHQFCRIAERNFICSGGWPSIFATHLGEYLGVQATKRPLKMRDFSFWRREGDVLVENWVMLDLFEIYEGMGADLWTAVA